MRSFHDAKAMARDLKGALAAKGFDVSHGSCLELVSKQLGFKDWNTLHAIIERSEQKRRPLMEADGWFSGGLSDPKVFRLGLDPQHPGVALIECLVDRAVEEPPAYLFGCLMQSVTANRYHGMALRLTAQLQVKDAGLGTIWMRVDGTSGSLRFDNMMDRVSDGALSGTTGWTERSIVLDVPREAVSLHYGFFLKGFGEVRARGFRIESLDTAMPITASPNKPLIGCKPLLPGPRNLGFNQAGIV